MYQNGGTHCTESGPLCRIEGILQRALLVLVSGLSIVGLQTARSQVAPAEQLTIKVDCQTCKGEGDVHRPGDKRGSTVVVQVLNEVGLPQPEADVKFMADQQGPSVFFGDGKDFVTVRTDAEGFATVPGIRGNNVKGAVTLHVSASFEGKTGSLNINQVNERGPVLNRTRGAVLAGALATTGIVLYEVYKPGPPTASINQATPTAGGPSSQSIPARRIRIGK